MLMKRSHDVFWATLGEGGLVLAMGVFAWFLGRPLIFASLGPTAYELVELPQIHSARAYNIIVGHLVGVGAAFLAVYVMHAHGEPNVMAGGLVTSGRVWAAAMAATLTTLVNLLLKAGQPAALATTLLVSLGAMQTGHDAAAIIAGVLIITAIGERVRRFRLKHTAIRPVVESTS
jgi:hypothetical protein